MDIQELKDNSSGKPLEEYLKKEVREQYIEMILPRLICYYPQGNTIYLNYSRHSQEEIAKTMVDIYRNARNELGEKPELLRHVYAENNT